MLPLEKTFRIVQRSFRASAARVPDRERWEAAADRLSISPFENPAHSLRSDSHEFGAKETDAAQLALAAYFATFPAFE